MALTDPYGKGDLAGVAVEPVLLDAKHLRRLFYSEKPILVRWGLVVTFGLAAQQPAPQKCLQPLEVPEEAGSLLERDLSYRLFQSGDDGGEVHWRRVSFDHRLLLQTLLISSPLLRAASPAGLTRSHHLLVGSPLRLINGKVAAYEGAG